MAEVAWSFSPLTRDGYPIELAFTSTGESIRYVCEIAGPETDPSNRLWLAFALVDELEVSDKKNHGNLDKHFRKDILLSELERYRKIQNGGILDYGAWVSGRHGSDGDAFKIYVEVPKGATSELDNRVQNILGNRPFLMGRKIVLRMVGLEVATGRLEFYFRADGMVSWEVARLMGLFGLTAEVDELFSLVDDITGRSTSRQLPCSHTGFSLSVEPNGVSTVFSIFFLARNLLGGDRHIRSRLLDVAMQRDWSFSHYAELTEPLAEQEGPRTKHGMMSFIAVAGKPPMLHVGLRPP